MEVMRLHTGSVRLRRNTSYPKGQFHNNRQGKQCAYERSKGQGQMTKQLYSLELGNLGKDSKLLS